MYLIGIMYRYLKVYRDINVPIHIILLHIRGCYFQIHQILLPT